MKRKRKSKTKAIEVSNEDEPPIEVQHMGPSITEYLPKSVFHNVLIKLPPRSILICKSVCKTWRDLISDPEFAKLHFAQSEPCTLVRPWGPTRVSRIFYMVEPEDSSSSGLKEGGTSMVNQCHPPMNISKWKIPLDNAQEAIDYYNYIQAFPKRKWSAKRKPDPHDHSFKLVNSCNGFLCLSETFFNEPRVVCNPVTGEFINLPQASKNEGPRGSIGCGFGFSPKTNQYKVIRTFQKGTPQLINLVEIHTLGTGSWTCLGNAPPTAERMSPFPTYVKGAIYWIYYGSISDYIVSFDFDNERFQSVPPPPFQLDGSHKLRLGVLGGCLCVCDAQDNHIDVWVMEDCGAQKSWTKKVSINIDDSWPGGHYKPMKYLKSGGLLMYHSDTTTVIDYHSRNYKFIHLKLVGLKSEFEAISHVPSFISLKDILMGDDVEVLNINSRCAECKLPGEARGIALEEEDADTLSKVIPRWGDRKRQERWLWCAPE